MCEHGLYRDVVVLTPAHLSHTRQDRIGPRPIDACIADLVADLNAAGLTTIASCCGHGTHGAGGVVFHDNTEMSVEEARRLLRDDPARTIPTSRARDGDGFLVRRAER